MKVVVSLNRDRDRDGAGAGAEEFVNRMCFCLIFFFGLCKHLYFCYFWVGVWVFYFIIIMSG